MSFTRIMLIAFAVLGVPVIVVTFVAAIETFILKPECAPFVDRNLATKIIEDHLRKPSSSAVLKGVEPRVLMIEEVGNFARNKGPDERAYRFRLVGSQNNNWPLARIDACGGLELSDNLAGE